MSNNFLDDKPEKKAGNGAAADRIEVNGVQKKKPRKPWTKKKTIILIACIVGGLAVLTGGLALAWNSVSSMDQFDNIAEQMTPPPSTSSAPAPTLAPGESALPEPSPTLDPYEVLLSQADTSFLKDTINIMLIGVDHSVERDTWRGKKAFHADVMIVLAINTKTGAVNMISLPRDTYAQIPGVKGIYKLNASIDCGGGWPSEANGYSTSGFDKVCEAATWMLGGIPVKYYYAVDMNAVKGLVDAIGGVQNFDLEFDFTMQGRSYRKGVQPHMDGQAVLDYLRVRKGIAEAGDLNRINRQKRMLVAIFDKIKQNGLLPSIPGILDAFDGNMYTNTTLSQTAALAAFAYNVEPDSIGMYSMGGHYKNIFNWNFVLTDQKARVKLIKDIYGVDVEQYKDYTSSAAQARWEKMRAPVIKERAEAALAKVKAKLDADAALPIPTPTPMPTPVPSTEPAPSPSESTEPAPSTSPTPTPTVPDGGSAEGAAAGIRPLSVSNPLLSLIALTGETQYRQYLPDGPVWALYNKAVAECAALGTQESTEELRAANDQLIADVQSLCSTLGIPLSSTYWRVNYETDKSFNEITVDFN